MSVSFSENILEKRRLISIILGADTDEKAVSLIGAKSASIKVTGITSDEIKVYTTMEHEASPSRWKQIFDEFDVNPFTEDGLYTLNSVDFAQLKIVRDGASDGDITIDIGISFE